MVEAKSQYGTEGDGSVKRGEGLYVSQNRYGKPLEAAVRHLVKDSQIRKVAEGSNLPLSFHQGLSDTLTRVVGSLHGPARSGIYYPSSFFRTRLEKEEAKPHSARQRLPAERMELEDRDMGSNREACRRMLETYN